MSLQKNSCYWLCSEIYYNAHGWAVLRSGSRRYDAFGLIGTTFRELDWKTLIFFERAGPISPNAPQVDKKEFTNWWKTKDMSAELARQRKQKAAEVVARLHAHVTELLVTSTRGAEQIKTVSEQGATDRGFRGLT